MNSPKITSGRLTLHADRPTAISSSRHGSNVDGVAFNLLFIARRQPLLAAKVLQLYREARQVSADNPKAHEEDYLEAKAQLDAQLTADGLEPAPEAER